MADLTPKQRRFVDEYLIDLNATQAAIRAGYSDNGAPVQGHRLLTNANVQAAIAERQKAIANSLAITPERIAAELAKIGFANMEDYLRIGEDGDPHIDLSKISREQAAAVASVTVEDFRDGRSDKREVRRIKFTLHDKEKALVDLGRHLGMFITKIEHSASDQFLEALKEINAARQQLRALGSPLGEVSEQSPAIRH